MDAFGNTTAARLPPRATPQAPSSASSASPVPNSSAAAQQAAAPGGATQRTETVAQANVPTANGLPAASAGYAGARYGSPYGYGSSPYSASSYAGGYGASSAYGGYGGHGGYSGSSMYGSSGMSGYGGMYGSSPYSSRYSMGAMYGAGAMPPSLAGGMGMANTVLGPGGEVVNSMHSVMHTVARVSGLMEEVLRNFHMIFESGFGLFMSLGVFRQEAAALLGIDKITASGIFKRIWRKVAFLWRVLVLFLMSPLAGRYSPVAVALRFAGLAPRRSDHQSSDAPARVEVQELHPEELEEDTAFEEAARLENTDDPDASNL